MTKSDILIKLAENYPNKTEQTLLVDWIRDYRDIKRTSGIKIHVSELYANNMVERELRTGKTSLLNLKDTAISYQRVLSFIIENSKDENIYSFLESQYHNKYFDNLFYNFLVKKLELSDFSSLQQFKKYVNHPHNPEIKYVRMSPYFIQLIINNVLTPKKVKYLNNIIYGMTSEGIIDLEGETEKSITLIFLTDLLYFSLVEDCLIYGEKPVSLWNQFKKEDIEAYKESVSKKSKNKSKN